MAKTHSFENLHQFFDKVKSVGFFERLFSWRTTVALSYDAYQEFKSIDKQIAGLEENIGELQEELKDTKKDYDHAKAEVTRLKEELAGSKKDTERNNKDLQEKEKELGKLKESDKKNSERVVKLDAEVETLQEKKDELSRQKAEIEKKLAANEKVEDNRKQEYEKKIVELTALTKRLDDDRIRLQEEREQEIAQEFENKKKTWSVHEASVENRIATICERHHIECFNKSKAPFKGNPDNALKICDEYIVFDAKSPQGDDLSNFSTYIKQQAEAAKKYIKEQNVKRDVFLVIPSNTTEVIKQYHYNLADYTVYVITLDALEPIILSLKRIEEYEFAENLSPEDRENICRVIGKFAHATKRRIQVDSYFCDEFVNLLNNCNTLPEDVLEQAIEFEKADKMNPPIEKRAKVISDTEIKRDTKHLKQIAEAQEIDTAASKTIETIPLYKQGSE